MNNRALLIDLDGVVRRWPSNDTGLEDRFGLPLGVIRSTAFEPTLVDRAITGRISDEQWRDIVAGQLQDAYPRSQAYEAIAAWSRPSGQIDHEVLNTVRAARQQGVFVVLVTNATSRLEADLAALNVKDEFNAIVNSSCVGVAKPAEGIFLTALAAAQVTASEAIFVDDQLVNVSGAQSIGIRSHHFQGIAMLKQYLAAEWNSRGAA